VQQRVGMLDSGLAVIYAARLKKLRRQEVPANTPRGKLDQRPNGLAVTLPAVRNAPLESRL
jgi:hypothetical protein